MTTLFHKITDGLVAFAPVWFGLAIFLAMGVE
jgi:hypothetical protein